MGLIKFGGGVSAISGKIGGTVYARNRGGAYARNWAKPTNTPTEKQSINRAAFGNQSKGWALLTKAQQDNWDALASTVSRLNRLGDAYTPTGRQIYLESANNMRIIGQTPLTDAPFSLLAPTMDEYISFAGTVDAGVVDSLEITGASATGGVSYVLDITKQFADLKKNFTLDYRQLKTGVTSAAYSFLADYIATYGSSGTVGNQISARIRYIDTQNGMSSPWRILTITLEAA